MGATAVFFGTTPASFIVNSSLSLTATAPPGSAGTVDITVTTPLGTSPTSAADGFTYVGPPAIAGIAPATGPVAGGTAVAIGGTGFTGATAVMFGATAAASFTVNSDTSISAVSPAGALGVTAITVVTAFGTSPTGGGGTFTYAPPAPTNGTITIRQVTDGGDGTFGFTSATPGLSLSIATTGGAGTSAAVPLAPGTYAVAAATSSTFGLTGIACDDGDSTGSVATRTATIVLAAGEGVTCTFTSSSPIAATTEAISELSDARGTIILGAQPSIERRIDRLNGVAPASGGPAAVLGYLPAIMSGAPPDISVSLAAIEELTGRPTSRFDAWFQATLGLFNNNGLTGSFSVLAAGADHLVDSNLLIGGFVQTDIIPGATLPGGGTIGGTGWLAGPYMTMRLGDGLYLDLLAGAGTSHNTVSPTGTYTDTFDASRWLASASLTGEFAFGPWTIAPTVRLGYFEETSAAYVDGLGVTIPSVRTGLGQLAVGPRISHRLDLEGGAVLTAAARFDGLLEIRTAAGATTLAPIRGRLELRLDLTLPGGATFGISGAYDGLGSSTTSAASATVRLLVPLD